MVRRVRRLLRGTSATPAYRRRIDAIAKEALRLGGIPRGGPRVLFGPSFAIYAPTFVHDRLLSIALRLRGADVIPIHCDGFQSLECNYFGGAWKNRPLAECCRGCIARTSVVAGLPGGSTPLSRFLTESDRSEATAVAEQCSDDGWTDYVFDGLPIGQWAKDITVNNYLVADYRLVAGYPELGRAQVANLLLLRTAYDRALDHFRPDRVVTNDSYYGMWALLQHLARRRGIPFFSHWGGVRRGGWSYAMDDAAMNLDFSKPWPEFSRIPLTSDEAASVEKWLRERRGGGELVLDTASASADGAYPEALARLDPTLPTALLAGNLVWDLAALDKQVVFADMIDWVVKTIEWFASRPQYQLIVKPHPGELHPSIPETRERVSSALESRGITVPPNVVVLPPRLRLSVYDLFAKVRVGLLHTSTVGIEMAAQDLTVITTGRAPYRGFGFTADPSTPSEYFHVLEQALSGERLMDAAIQRDLSWKFTRFYQFHYPIRLGLFDYSWGSDPRVQVESAKELMPGHNPLLDWVTGSILQGLPIVAENRWPSAS